MRKRFRREAAPPSSPPGLEDLGRTRLIQGPYPCPSGNLLDAVHEQEKALFQRLRREVERRHSALAERALFPEALELLGSLTPEEAARIQQGTSFRAWLIRLASLLLEKPPSGEAGPAAPRDARRLNHLLAFRAEVASGAWQRDHSDPFSFQDHLLPGGRLRLRGSPLWIQMPRPSAKGGARAVGIRASGWNPSQPIMCKIDGQSLRVQDPEGRHSFRVSKSHLAVLANMPSMSGQEVEVSRGIGTWPRLPLNGSLVLETKMRGRTAFPRFESLARAMHVLFAYWPRMGAMVGSLAQEIDFAPEAGLRSRTYPGVPGLVTLGPGPRPAVQEAELLVHETGHLLLYELARLVPIVAKPLEPLDSPWKREPRPAIFLLHAVFSFLLQTLWLLHYERGTARPSKDRQRRIEREAARLRQGLETLRMHERRHGSGRNPILDDLGTELELLREHLAT